MKETVVFAWFEALFASVGEVFLLFLSSFFRPKSIVRRYNMLIERIYFCSFGSLLVILVVATFTGMVIALQTGLELKTYGQQSQIGYLISSTMSREMGPVMTAFILTGLVGSSYAAELGSMVMNEEIDALKMMAIDPIDFLVVPRLFALIIVMPAMTLISDIVGTLGGAFVGRTMLKVPFEVYFDKALNVIDIKDLYSGLIKAVVFGAIIASISCYHGLKTHGGAIGVGLSVLRSVVISFVAVLVFDYIITWIVY